MLKILHVDVDDDVHIKINKLNDHNFTSYLWVNVYFIILKLKKKFKTHCNGRTGNQLRKECHLI